MAAMSVAGRSAGEPGPEGTGRGLRRARTGPFVLLAATAAVTAAVVTFAAYGEVAFLQGPSSARQRRTARMAGTLATAASRPDLSVVARRSTEALTEAGTEDLDLGERPSPPNSTEAMCKQAADAVMRAYRDGYTRQTVRLRTDAVYSGDNLYREGIQALLTATLPLLQSFTRKLWGGDYLKDVRTSIVDNEVGTLLYREAENALMDASVFFLPGRDLVTSPKMMNFFSSMGDRLVVLANTEQASASWKVENKGKDFYLVSESDVGLRVCETFKQQSYYYYQCPINNWQMTFFRAYPHPWEIFIEDLNYNLVKVGESEEKPVYDTIIGFMEVYEAANNIKVSQKVGKYLKDNQAGEGAPSWPE
mmetsp:Transcript_64703/g.169442  ORF Transcript_64703/g.169442 Transcript_64703/m.169442 type:complete len:363 (-) Transcript_64703:257-1345(-)